MHTQETIRALNRLVRVCRDSEDFCRASAARTANPDLGSLLLHRSEEWGRLGDELQALVLLLGGDPATSGTLAARMRQAWLALRHAALGPTDATTILEWQSVERQAEGRYAQAMEGYLPERIRRTLTLQADRVANRSVQIGALLGEHAIHLPGLN